MLHDQIANVKEFLELPAVLEGESAKLIGDAECGLMSFWLRLIVFLRFLWLPVLLVLGYRLEDVGSNFEL